MRLTWDRNLEQDSGRLMVIILPMITSYSPALQGYSSDYAKAPAMV